MSEFEKVDLRKATEEEIKKSQEALDLIFKFNNTSPTSEESGKIIKELVGKVGENTQIMPPLSGAALEHLKIGANVFINSNLLAMARGGITIEDNVMFAANVQLLSNNHDEYEREILTCKPIHIKKGAWIGAGATILPGVTIGKHAIVGASAVVTKDIGDYEVAVGNPAKVIKTLDEEKFKE